MSQAHNLWTEQSEIQNRASCSKGAKNIAKVENIKVIKSTVFWDVTPCSFVDLHLLYFRIIQPSSE
jgi:hypothetical protein